MQRINSGEEESIEACIDALDETTTALSHHPPCALAVALGIHLGAVLTLLRQCNEYSAEEVREWSDEVIRGALDSEP